MMSDRFRQSLVGLPRVEYEKAREVIQKALALDNDLAEACAVLRGLRLCFKSHI